ncbi:MAG: 3-deoxy-7-phosphoheptulonate synthase [Oscillospiraceae bacterium]|nr:3-deoxy-7-phosphoheptulonate synthase [Oscillospiraceae bacterium]
METNFVFMGKIPAPHEIKAQYPLSDECAEIKEERDRIVRGIIDGSDKRLLLIMGPCSADREDAVMAYLERLRTLQDKVSDKIFIVPRLYTNKPRTTGEGYKGMLHSPDPNARPNLIKGVIAIRKLHMRALQDYGFSCADEMLYPENHRYLSDLLSYVAVGARSVEDQQHRLTASGLEIPVGMKNPTSGDLTVMLNGIYAAQHGHMFCYCGWEVQSRGNPYTHAILRGYVDAHGRSSPNYHYEDIMRLLDHYGESELKNPAVIVDANHANSGKKYLEQVRICKEVLHSCRYSADVRGFVKGLMVESYLLDGCSKVGEAPFGQSITDPCLGWEKTERLVLDMADSL